MSMTDGPEPPTHADVEALINAEARKRRLSSPRLPRLWSPERVAEQLDVPVTFVRTLISRGKLEVVKLGHRTLRVPEASLKAYLRELTK